MTLGDYIKTLQEADKAPALARFTVSGYGRTPGAIGVFHPVSTVVTLPAHLEGQALADAARAAFYAQGFTLGPQCNALTVARVAEEGQA